MVWHGGIHAAASERRVFVKKINALVFLVLFSITACVTEKAISETSENTIALDEKIELDDGIIGNYIFSSVDIYENKDIDISKYKNLDKDIYVKVIKIALNTYKLESNFWLLKEAISLDNNFEHNQKYGKFYEVSTDEYHPPLIANNFSAIKRESSLVISYYKNSIIIDYNYNDSRLDKVYITEETNMTIAEDGTITSVIFRTLNSHYAPLKTMINCKIIFQRDE
jgi:hypothetical protein